MSRLSRFSGAFGLADAGPKLFGEEGHERMQQLEDLVERPGGGGLTFGLCVLVGRRSGSA